KPKPEGKTEQSRQSGKRADPGSAEPAPVPGQPLAVRFESADAHGVAIPSPLLPAFSAEAFVLTPQPPVTLRSLIVVWRRFQKRLRQGPKVELDVTGSIAEQCRAGRLLAPVLRAERKNQARLVVLIDVSPSMTAWSMLLPLWTESMIQGQLG